MAYTREELLAEKQRRAAPQTGGYSKEDLMAEKQRRMGGGSSMLTGFQNPGQSRLGQTPMTGGVGTQLPEGTVEKAGQLQQDASGAANQFGSQLLGGIPEYALRSTNPEQADKTFPAPQTTAGKVMYGGASLAGALMGPAGKLAGAVAKGASLTGGLAGKIPNLIGGAFAGATQRLPGDKFEGMDKEVIKSARQAALGSAFAGGVSIAARGVRDLGRFVSKTQATNFIEKRVLPGFYRAKRAALDRFGDKIDELVTQNPDRGVDITDEISQIQSNRLARVHQADIAGGKTQPSVDDPFYSSTLDSAASRSKNLNALLNNPQKAQNLTVREAQDLINELKGTLPKNLKNAQSSDIPVIDLLDNIRGKQLQAFPELGEVRSAYAETLKQYGAFKTGIQDAPKAYDLFRGEKFRKNKVMQKYAQDLVGDKLFEELMGFNKTASRLQAVNTLLKVGAGSALVAGAVHKAIPKNLGGE